jgi:hypothetical protein
VLGRRLIATLLSGAALVAACGSNGPTFTLFVDVPSGSNCQPDLVVD